uniref:Uncharacterized protein n=1 Tax=Arundo donax TaxID=35708 RepID=A0A0A9BHY1_ARUDO
MGLKEKKTRCDESCDFLRGHTRAREEREPNCEASRFGIMSCFPKGPVYL